MIKHDRYGSMTRFGKAALLFSIVLVLSCSYVRSNGQTLQYRISWKGDSIGYITAQKIRQQSQESYHIVTEAKVSILFDFKMVTDFNTDFEGGSLKRAYTKSLLNDKNKHYSKVLRTSDGYEIETENGKSVLHGAIKESIVTMYFKQPAPGKIFSERYGEMCELTEIEKGKYKLKKPNGKTNYYYFENGVCTGGEINLSLATIIFEKIN